VSFQLRRGSGAHLRPADGPADFRLALGVSRLGAMWAQAAGVLAVGGRLTAFAAVACLPFCCRCATSPSLWAAPRRWVARLPKRPS